MTTIYVKRVFNCDHAKRLWDAALGVSNCMASPLYYPDVTYAIDKQGHVNGVFDLRSNTGYLFMQVEGAEAAPPIKTQPYSHLNADNYNLPVNIKEELVKLRPSTDDRVELYNLTAQTAKELRDIVDLVNKQVLTRWQRLYDTSYAPITLIITFMSEAGNDIFVITAQQHHA